MFKKKSEAAKNSSSVSVSPSSRPELSRKSSKPCLLLRISPWSLWGIMILNLMHMQILIFGVIILALAVGCRTNMILIDGVPTERTQFCIGEELTLLCQNNTAAYTWVYPGGRITVARANFIENENGFTATYINVTTTTLQFVVSRSMSSIITISCINVDGINISAINLGFLGMTSMTCPRGIFAVGMDNCTSVDVALHGVSRCTREYSASISGGTEVTSSVLNEANHNAEFLAVGSFNLTNSSLELCNTYYVSVNVTYFDNSSMACLLVAVELPTNPTTMSISPTTTLGSALTMRPPSSTSFQLTIIIVIVVVAVVVPGIIIFMIIILVIIKCKKKKKIWPAKGSLLINDNSVKDPESASSHVVLKNVIKIKELEEKNSSKSSEEDSLLYSTVQVPQTTKHEKAPDGSLYSMVDRRDKKGRNEEISKDSYEGLQTTQHEKAPDGSLYSVVNRQDKKGKKDKNEEISKDGNELVHMDIMQNTSSSFHSS